MFRQVFNPENLVWRILAKAVDFVGLSLFWALLSLPIVTIGPATAALYYTVVKVFRQWEDDSFSVMWKQFVKNLRKGIPASLICIPLMLVIAYGYTVMLANSGSDLGAILFVIYYIVLVIPVGMMLYLFPIMGRFELGLGEMFRTAMILTIRHLPSTLILVLLNVQLIIFTIEKWTPIFVTPVGAALLSSIFLEQIFMKYLSREQIAAFRNMTLEELEEEEEYLAKKKAAKKNASGKNTSKKNASR